MDLRLQGKTALITGSTAGIGLAIASTLQEEGAAVIINGRTRQRIDQSLAKLGNGATGIVADLTTKEGREVLYQQVRHVDILVNNLGIFESKALTDVAEEDWSKFFDVNVVSGAVLSKHYFAAMRNKNWGRVIFIASEAGINVPADMIPYGVSKAAQTALARGLAETTAGTGITVNTVLPGPTRSEGVDRFLASLDFGNSGDEGERQFLRKLRPTSLLGRFAEAKEVATLVAYLASPLASATNGAALRVEGGLLRNVF